ncbi:hypothetical protein DFJ77DRAFT_458188 [Powellomyces hirtus]|nr:hypothetical protein DFJ77DRAFT_458188 [Powellomyces hirtus]
MKTTICILAQVAILAATVSAHGKLIEPLGLNVNTAVDLNSQADVAIGVTRANACGTVLANPGAIDRSDMAPRANFVAGSSATVTYHIVNQDGAGPLTAAFSPDNGATWTNAPITANAPGRFGINNANRGSKGQDVPITLTVPDMNCPAGSCLLQVRNPITFGSCAPVSITQGGGQTEMIKTFANSGGKPAGQGLVGPKAGGVGFVDPQDLPGNRG